MTSAGRAYQSGLTPTLRCTGKPDRAGDRAIQRPGADIGVGPTFAMKWLIPAAGGLSSARTRHIDVRITTGGAAAPFGDDWSCGIKLGDGEWPGLVAEPLVAADLLPVCAHDWQRD